MLLPVFVLVHGALCVKYFNTCTIVYSYISKEIHFRLRHRLHCRVSERFAVMMYLRPKFNKNPCKELFVVFCFVLQMSVQQMLTGDGEARVSTGSGVKCHYSPIISLFFFLETPSTSLVL